MKRSAVHLFGTSLLISLCIASLAANAQDSTEARFADKTTDEIEAALVNGHPGAYYMAALELAGARRMDEAVFWFYAGQLRYRFHLAANPDLDPSGDPALFGAYSAMVGVPINEYAFGDIDQLVATIDEVLAWDAEVPNGFTSTTDHADAWQEQREGLRSLRDEIIARADEIRRTREANGLENH